MKINKKNQNLIDKELNLHDLYINSILFKLDVRKIVMEVFDEKNSLHLYTITFENVFEFLFSSIKKDSDPYDNIILGWEEIPNKYTKDYFLDEVKEKFISNGGTWNPDFFAIRILTVPMKEIKIICEEIKIIREEIKNENSNIYIES
jgi:hypothetical protein